MTTPEVDLVQPRRLDVDGAPIRWLESGEGFPVVLIHGTPRRTGAVAQRHPLAGHDLGGGVAQIAAVRARERCAGLVLTNPIGYDSWPIPSIKALRATAPIVRHLPDATLYPVVATLFARGHDDLRVARQSLSVHWSSYSRHDGASALARQVRSLDVNDTLTVADRLGDLDVPAELVWGAADRFQLIQYGQRFADDLDTELQRIEGGKHFVPEDHPGYVANAIDRVLEPV